jgi:hypothetical protein
LGHFSSGDRQLVVVHYPVLTAGVRTADLPEFAQVQSAKFCSVTKWCSTEVCVFMLYLDYRAVHVSPSNSLGA